MNKSGILLLLLASVYFATTSTKVACEVGDDERLAKETDGDVSEKRQEELLKQPEQLTIIAPKYIRPQSSYHVLVSLANSAVPATVDLQLIGGRDTDREQTEAKSVLASPDESQTVKFSIGDWPAAEYVLTVNAQAVDRSWNFTGEKDLSYQAKSFSCFIQTDKAIYKPGQQVQFRALFLSPTLTPELLKNAINVTVLDPKQNVIKQWQYLSNYRGLLSLDMPLTDDPMFGDYTIRVEARGQEFTKQFTVSEYVLPTFGVTIQLPKYATFNKPDIDASVKASYTYGKPVQGHVTLTVQPLSRYHYIAAEPLQQNQYKARLAPDGSADFRLNLVKDLKLVEEAFERNIEFFALVEEDLTGRTYNQTQTLQMFNNNVKIELVDRKQKLKPGMSQHLRYKVAYQDDTPVEDSGPKVELKYTFSEESTSKFSLRPQGGFIEHELEVPLKVPGLEQPPAYVAISAKYRNQEYKMGINSYQSKSHQYIQIRLPQLHSAATERRSRLRAGERKPLLLASSSSINIDDQLKVEVHSTEPMQQVTCQGFARGDIVWALSKQVKNETKFEFDVKIDQRMAPQMRIICFRVRQENKELIADSVDLPVGGLVRNVIKLSPSRNEAKPGQEVDVGVFTKPNSLVGILGVDQSVLLLKSGNDLDQKDIMNDIRSYGSLDAPSDHLFGEDTYTSGLFKEANVVVLTNNLIHTYKSPQYDSFLFKGISLQTGQPAALEAIPVAGSGPAPVQEPIRIRTLFPETWLWQNGTADSQGQIKFGATVPDTITSWQLSAFSLSESHGLALTSEPASIRVFRPFFIKLNLPYSMIRGETVVIQAIVFNYSKRPVVAKVTLDNQKGEFEFVEAANTIEDEKSSSSVRESRQVSVPAEDGASVSFLIKPVKLGHIDVRIVAQTSTFGDGIVKKLLVKPPGQEQRFNRAMLIQLPGPQSTWSRNVSIEVPSNAVDGSQKVFVSAIGDIIGAGLSNVDDLLKLPHGCGEQNMINLVPNIVILNYLRATGRLRPVQHDKATKNIETGYQRQLNYKRSDGSFSAFGQSDKVGSVWLTAYVLRTFQQAKSIVTVDESVLARAADFLARHSQPDGSIKEVGMLHNKALASSSLQGEGAATGQSSVYLTAYSMIALLQRSLEAPPTSTSGAGSTNDTESRSRINEVIQRGLDYLERQLDSSTPSTYDLAIIAYTMNLAGGKRQSAANRAYDKLWERANELNDQIWWSNSKTNNDDSREETTDSPAGSRQSARLSASSSTVPPLKAVGVKTDQSAHWFVPNSLDVEITSWALLTTVRRGDNERALPIVRWLVSQQNSHGGFASTQDTVLATEALAAFAEASASNKSPLSIDVEFIYPRVASNTSSTGRPLRRTNLDQMLISQPNALVYQQTRLPDNVTWVQIQATGAGTAVVQVSWQYNLLVSAERPAFYLNPIIDQRSNINYLQLSVCTFYKGQGEASNMAVAEVELPSGYVADVEALPSLKRHAQIKRIDTDNGETKVIVYLDKVTREELCFTVPAHRSSKVSNNKPVPVSIYDYYDRKQAARVFYEPKPASSCDICDSDSCKELCASKSNKRSDKLISLHEQRQAKLQQQQQDTNRDTEPVTRSRLIDGSTSGQRVGNNWDCLGGTSNVTKPNQAYQYLPFATRVSNLACAVKKSVV